VLALTNATVVTGDAVLRGHAVVVEDERIAAVVPADEVPAGAQREDLGGAVVAPGLVDLQVNGGGDVLFGDDPSPAAVARIAEAHRRLGTTTLMPTLISPGPDVIRAAQAAVRASRDPGVLGLHVEGPFLDPDRAGIHDPRAIRRMTPEDAELLAGLGEPAIVTLAPERVAPEFVERLAAAGVHVAAGHSSATPAELDAAVACGLRLVTHVFNAMSGIAAREPGLAGAALADDRVACSVITDGVHVAPATLRLALRAKPRGRLFLVSDALPPVGGTATAFAVGGVPVTVRDGRCVGPGGVLAGSNAPLAEGVRRLVALGVAVTDALWLASTAPADAIGTGDRAGRIAPGRRADLVVAGATGTLRRVMAGGRFVRR
jgi:N-acetylglucosamine-6-phosphate deacetylase